jgi:chromosome segregation ATPase
LPKLEFDISVKEGGLKELTKQINLVKQETSKLVAEFGKESTQAQLAGQQLEKLTNQKRQLTKPVTELGGGVKRSAAQLLEMGENITTVAAGIGTALYGITSLAKESVKLSVSLTELRSHFQGSEQDLELFRTAVSGTVSDANLIKLSNQAGDLGISLDKQALLFSLAEDAADKYGGTVEENFSKVVMATEGNMRGLRALGIQKAVYNQTVKDLVKAHGGEIEVLQGVNGEQEINIQKLNLHLHKF